MNQPSARRFKVTIEESPPHGDLYQLETTTYFHVMDIHTQKIVMTFEGTTSASLSRDTGQWQDFQCNGVSEVSIALDESVVLVRYGNGEQKTVPLPS